MGAFGLWNHPETRIEARLGHPEMPPFKLHDPGSRLYRHDHDLCPLGKPIGQWVASRHVVDANAGADPMLALLEDHPGIIPGRGGHLRGMRIPKPV